jgi:hypothetical protein
MRPLHGGTDKPEQSDRYREPNRQRTAGASDFMREPPGQRSEDRQCEGNKNDMNAEDFANKEGRAIEIGFPFHDANQKQVQKRDGQLREDGNPQQKIKRDVF